MITIEEILNGTLGTEKLNELNEVEKKRLIFELIQEVESLREILELIPGNLYWKNLDHVYQGCNKNLADQIHLKSCWHIKGNTVFNYLSEKDAIEVNKTDEDIIKQGYPVEIEEIGFNNAKTFLTKKIPLRDKQGKIRGLLGISFDITERKKAEEELRKTREAEAISKAKLEFLENMRHDIRTALNGIEGCAQIILDETKERNIKEYAESLIISCRVLTHIHNQILSAIRIFDGTLPLYKKKFNLESKLRQLINLNLAKALSKKLDIKLEYDENIPAYLIGDSKRIPSVALELMTNALKYTEKGCVTVKAELYKKEARNLTLKFSVIDTGIGMPFDKQEEIFTRFKRLSPSYEGKYKGLGLGLSVVKQFMDDLDGEIYVKSEPNQGTTIAVYIQVKEALANNAENLDESEDIFGSDIEMGMGLISKPKLPKTEITQFAGKSRILVVEDQPIAAQVASGILSNLNCVVDVAENGKEALEKASVNTYDLIFMDVGLPDMDGNAVTRQIREMERDTELHVPIVALTAHVDSEHKQRCVEAGMDAVLNKPLVKERAADMLSAFIPSRSKKLEKSAVDEEIAEEMDHLFNLEGVVIDLEQGADLVAADEDMAKNMLEMMLKNFNEEKTDLVKAHKAKDWNKVKDIVHKLRGGMAYCGTPRLHQAGLHLEDYLKTEQTDFAEKLYEQFISEVEKVKTEFEAFE